ncbi:hypothetical protein CLHUN_35820 [Ruminiclostridium hungatei]|uniref:Uncharacterized protein n=1 Tax=Ruminiclostridium hungatei TaxID=48256 RepID=A0A1V4SGQ7_RUMHU|nr:hypothetical protein [Ruminiclostridium hungatei]OPX42446.1 hypothetical protein CLHUN_35710 [Ruminiclostridium hungatei]OPX42457.1 hypothetical protein CLHUN_35820 [Ruminiclostridium hungatei]
MLKLKSKNFVYADIKIQGRVKTFYLGRIDKLIEIGESVVTRRLKELVDAYVSEYDIQYVPDKTIYGRYVVDMQYLYPEWKRKHSDLYGEVG